MEADWYVDPLDRFDGRFFDGQEWTNRVSNGGVHAVDPDFPLSPSNEPGDGEADRAQVEGRRAAGFEEGPGDPGPAVAPVANRSRLRASLMAESPVRTVAVLDSSIVRPDHRPTKSRAPIVWGLLGLIAALFVAGLVLWDRDQPQATTEAVELDQEQEARVQDLEEGGAGEAVESAPAQELEVDAPPVVVRPGQTFAAAEAIEVGGLRVLNGTSVLTELGDWHAGFAAERGIDLDDTAACWFGQLGGAAVQVAHCGPVGGSADTEFVFDSVPLLFEESADGQIAQPVVDAAMVDAVLANALTLVGDPDTPPPKLDQD